MLIGGRLFLPQQVRFLFQIQQIVHELELLLVALIQIVGMLHPHFLNVLLQSRVFVI